MVPQNLTLVTDAGRTDPTFALVEDFAATIADVSDGRLTITPFAAGELVGAFEVFDAVTSGQVDLGWSILGARVGSLPAYGAFDVSLGAAPGADDSGVAYEVLSTSDLDIFGERFLAAAFFGSTLLATNARVETPEDLQGLKLRAAGIDGAILRSELGVSIQNLPGSEIFAATATGVIDGAFASPLLFDATGLADATQTVYVDPAGRFLGPVLRALTINEDSYARLPADLRSLLDAETGRDLSREWGERVADIYADALTETGVTRDPFSDSVIAAYEGGAARYLTTEDPSLREVFEAFQAARAPGTEPIIRGTDAADRLSGTNGDDTIEAGAGDDDLRGGGGMDLLLGGAGDDTLRAAPGSTLDGGLGSDLYLAFGGRFDIVEAADAPGIDTIRTDSRYTPIPGIERVELQGTADLRIDGSSGDEILVGNRGDNLIVGFGGEDTVTGGNGSDTFAFFALQGTPVMQITDFDAPEGDRLAIDDALIGLGSHRIEPRDFTAQDFRDARELGTVAYRRAEGEILIDRDGRDGANDFTLLAMLAPGTMLTLDDILLF